MTVGEHITCPPAIASGGTIRIRSERAAQVARWFGLDRRIVRRGGDAGATRDADTQASRDVPATFESSPPALPPALASASAPAAPCASAPAPPPASAPVALTALALRPGTITLIAGPSGAGKSTLLRATRAAHPNRRWIDLARLASTPAVDDVPLVDCFEHLSLREALALLARVGLGEAWTYLRTPAELSDGQRWRFRLALALHDAAGHAADAPVIACDEFAAVLDRVTALVVAHRLRRAIDAPGGAAVLVATSHEDIEPALAPDVTIRCDFGRAEVMNRQGRQERKGRQERRGKRG